jgi:hypothetical protein
VLQPVDGHLRNAVVVDERASHHKAVEDLVTVKLEEKGNVRSLFLYNLMRAKIAQVLL